MQANDWNQIHYGSSSRSLLQDELIGSSSWQVFSAVVSIRERLPSSV